MEGILLGREGIAVSQQSAGGLYDPMHQSGGEAFEAVARFTAGLVADWATIPLEPATLLNVNAPAGVPKGVQVTKLGRRVYKEDLIDLGPSEDDDGGRVIRIYAQEPTHDRQDGSDLTAVDDGYIAVTPLHFDLTAHTGIEVLGAAGLGSVISPLEPV